METLASKSAGRQMEWSKNGYKPLKIIQKMFADLFVYGGSDFEPYTCTFSIYGIDQSEAKEWNCFA